MRQHHSTDINYRHMQGDTIFTYTKNIRLSVYMDDMKREKEKEVRGCLNTGLVKKFVQVFP